MAAKDNFYKEIQLQAAMVQSYALGDSLKRRHIVLVYHFEHILIKLFTCQSVSMGTDFLTSDEQAIREFNSLLDVQTLVNLNLSGMVNVT